MKNPLLEKFENKYGIPEFNKFSLTDYVPAFEKSIKIHNSEIDKIIENSEEPSFENILNALEKSGKDLSRVSRIFYNLLSADSSDELNEIATKISPILSRHNDEIILNQKLKKPYLGFCLGCQLLGEVIGGQVVKSNPAEIGMMDINFTQEKESDNLFSKFPNQINLSFC